MAKFLWIQNALQTLKNYGLSKVGITEDEYKSKVIKLNSGKSEGIKDFTITMYPQIIDCSKIGKLHRKCELNDIVNKKKSVLKEFSFEDGRRPSNWTITAMTVSPSDELQTACKECYYKYRTISLLDAVPHTKLEVRIPKSSESDFVNLFLAGVKVKEDQNVLCLSFEKDKKRETCLISYFNKELVFERLTPLSSFLEVDENLPAHLDSDGLMIDLKNRIESVEVEKAEVTLVNVDKLYFLDERKIALRLKTRYSSSFDNSFKIFDNFEEIIKNSRNSIEKMIPEKEEKKEEKKEIPFFEKVKSKLLENEIVKNHAAKIVIGVILGIFTLYSLITYEKYDPITNYYDNEESVSDEETLSDEEIKNNQKIGADEYDDDENYNESDDENNDDE